MISNKPTSRFDHQVFDLGIVFKAIRLWQSNISAPLGGFSPISGIVR